MSYSINIETKEFNESILFTGGLTIQDPEKDEWGFDRTTLLTIIDDKTKKSTIKVDWCVFSLTEISFTTLLIPETDKLFIGGRFFWGIIDLKKMKVDRLAKCMTFWAFEKHGSAIVVISELEAESVSLDGKAIHKVPVDPPFEMKVFEEKIEFTSPGFGQQMLRLK